MTTDLPTRHLDMGCGGIPRNPYRRDEVVGVDLNAPAVVATSAARVVPGDLTLQPIPFPDAYFDSVSAFDFLEHVPRVLPARDGLSLRFPFVELMSEVSRVLRPGGLFYALTPAYPAQEAFTDPTHVNILTRSSHRYFVGEAPLARMYGYTGNFRLRRAEWVVYNDALDPLAQPDWTQRLRRLRHRLKRKLRYLAWEFERTTEVGAAGQPPTPGPLPAAAGTSPRSGEP
jgi:SAM-dependent methyltransferase